MGLTVIDSSPIRDIPDIFIYPPGTRIETKIFNLPGYVAEVHICPLGVHYRCSVFVNGDPVYKDFYDFELNFKTESGDSKKRVGFLGS